MTGQSAIDLTKTPAFSLGTLSLRPASHELILGKRREILEPRVMQVLIALARENGDVVTREALTESCWEGRIVGEDAIHRVLSRLRRVTSGIGKDVFRIDTVTKAGYRLILLNQAEPTEGFVAQHNPSEPLTPSALSRRVLIAGAATGLAAIAGGGWMIAQLRGSKVTQSPEVLALMAQAEIAQGQQTVEGQNQAIGLLRRVVSLRPSWAEGWAALAYVYFLTSRYRDTPSGNAMRLRGDGAVARALELDPSNAVAVVSRSMRHGTNGHWLEIERALDSLDRNASTPNLVLTRRQMLYGEVGRERASLAAIAVQNEQTPLTPSLAAGKLNALWCARRFDEAEQFADEAAEVFPTHFALWFQRCYFYLYTGRPDRSLAMIDNVSERPSVVASREFDELRIVAQALQSGDPIQGKAALAIHLARAREGSGRAENTIQFASALGRIDEAFAIIEAYYFARGFNVPELRFTREQGTYLRADDRLTGFLFNPALEPLRDDRRFDRLVADLGLKKFWRASGKLPDYLSSA